MYKFPNYTRVLHQKDTMKTICAWVRNKTVSKSSAVIVGENISSLEEVTWSTKKLFNEFIARINGVYV